MNILQLNGYKADNTIPQRGFGYGYYENDESCT